MAASDGYINTYIDDCEGGGSGRKIATAAPKELNASRTTKITVTLFTIISTYFPLAAEKSGGTTDRVTADSPYNGARCSGRDCITNTMYCYIDCS